MDQLLALSADIWIKAVIEHRRLLRQEIMKGPINGDWVTKTATYFSVVRNFGVDSREQVAKWIDQYRLDQMTKKLDDPFQAFEDRVIQLSTQLMVIDGARHKALSGFSKLLFLAWPEAGFIYDSQINTALAVLGGKKDANAGIKRRSKTINPAEHEFINASKRFRYLFSPFLNPILKELVLTHDRQLIAIRIIDKALWLAGNSWIATAALNRKSSENLIEDTQLGKEIAYAWQTFVHSQFKLPA